MSGAPLWSWSYAKASRYIEPSDLAVSSSCDAVAVLGRPGYKYTWLARRSGGARALATTSTPQGAAFDHLGEHLAVGTAASDVHLFTMSGALKWKTTITETYCVITRLAFSDDDRSLLVLGRGTAVLRADGSVAWTANGNEMVASRDLRTFVTWWQPSHGPGWGSTVARDAGGQMLWPDARITSTVGAVVSRDGERIAAWVNVNQEPAVGDEFKQDLPRALQVMNRQGAVLATIPAPHGELLAFSPKADRVLLKTPTQLIEVDEKGQVTFQILLNADEESRGIVSRVLLAADYSGLLLVQGRAETRVQWFELRPA